MEAPDVVLCPLVDVEIENIDCIENSDAVDGIIKKVLLELNTGSFGDGKIFVKDIENAVKIRTGETGEEAL